MVKIKVHFTINDSVELEFKNNEEFDNLTHRDMVSMAAEILTQTWEYEMDMWEYDHFEVLEKDK